MSTCVSSTQTLHVGMVIMVIDHGLGRAKCIEFLNGESLLPLITLFVIESRFMLEFRKEKGTKEGRKEDRQNNLNLYCILTGH